MPDNTVDLDQVSKERQFDPKSFYPSRGQVEQWIENVWKMGNSIGVDVNPLENSGFAHQYGVRHIKNARFVEFVPDQADTFYCYWQPTAGPPGPLLVHTPGYGTEVSAHPDLVMQGFNVLHINPLGYATPDGLDIDRVPGSHAPVLPETITSKGQKGYREWLIDCVTAIKWAQSQSSVLQGRVSFFGSSQGGFGALVLGSVYKGRGACCVAADMPYLTNIPLMQQFNPDNFMFQWITSAESPKAAWYALGLVDTLSHAHRLTLPVMLVAGGADRTCPAKAIESLFEKLPSTRSYTYLEGQPHAYSTEFIALATGWFRMYA